MDTTKRPFGLISVFFNKKTWYSLTIIIQRFIIFIREISFYSGEGKAFKIWNKIYSYLNVLQKNFGPILKKNIKKLYFTIFLISISKYQIIYFQEKLFFYDYQLTMFGKINKSSLSSFLINLEKIDILYKIKILKNIFSCFFKCKNFNFKDHLIQIVFKMKEENFFVKMFFPKNFYIFKLKNIEHILCEKKSYLFYKKLFFTKNENFQYCHILSQLKVFSNYKMKKKLFFKAYNGSSKEKNHWLIDIYSKRTYPEKSKDILKIENPTHHYVPRSYHNLSTQLYSKGLFLTNLSKIFNKASKKKIRWSTLGKIMKFGPKNIEKFFITIKKSYLFETSLNFQRQFLSPTDTFLILISPFIPKKHFIIRRGKIFKKLKKILNNSKINHESSI